VFEVVESLTRAFVGRQAILLKTELDIETYQPEKEHALNLSGITVRLSWRKQAWLLKNSFPRNSQK
jgi:hypothetical protein